MAEEKRDCTNCGNGIICACTAFNQWQPIAQEKPMEKIQHTKEEWASIIDDLDWNPDVMVELEQKGYIRKTALEEAEEMYKEFFNYIYRDGAYHRDNDQWQQHASKLTAKQHEAIQELKSEIARLKK